jgi:hypothetical protein
MVGARTFPGNPYDGHLLTEQLDQVAVLLEDTGKTPLQVVVDLGFGASIATTRTSRSFIAASTSH